MKANEVIKKLNELGYSVAEERYLNSYNATIHYVDIEGELISLEHQIIVNGSSTIDDEITEREYTFLLDIVKSGIKKDRQLVIKAENCSMCYHILEWGRGRRSLNDLYCNFVNYEAVFSIEHIDVNELEEYENGIYIVSACSISSKAERKILALLRLNGIKIAETNAIEDFRVLRNMTQKQLSERTGIAQSKLSSYENLDSLDTLAVGTLKKIASAFDCTIDDLL